MKLFNIDSPVMQTLSKIADLMLLNIVFLICCLPIVTIGAALTGLNYVTLKMAEKEEGYIIKGFFKSFRQNFFQSTVMWIIMLVIAVVLGLDFYIISEATGTIFTVIRITLAITVVLYLMVFTYLFSTLARFYNSIKNTFRNALLMSIADFPKTLLMMVLMVGSVLFTFFNGNTLAYGILIWILCGFSLISYVNSLFQKKIFAKYSPKKEEENENPDEWVLDEVDQKDL